MRTRFTALTGIEKPVMQGGMQWVGYAELAAAVSNAGGLGLVTALSQPTPDDLHAEIKRARELTDKPIGINLTTLPTINPPPYDEYRDAAIQAGIDVVETSGSNPAAFTRHYQDAGVTVIHKVTSVKHALKAAEAGVDAITVDGFECAGHPGEDDIPGLVLIPAVADRVHDRVKRRIVSNDEHETNLIFRELNNTARVARNSISDKVVEILGVGGVFEDVRELVAGRRGKQVYETGDLDAGIWWAGLSQVFVHDVPSCHELLERIINEAESIVSDRLSTMMAD